MPLIDIRVCDVEQLPLCDWATAIAELGLDETSKQYLRGRYQMRRNVRRMSHRNDPATSRAAAERTVLGGSKERHIQTIAHVVRVHPGRTNGELAEATRIDYHEVARRAPEAAERGLIHRETVGGEPYKRPCRVRGTPMTVWLPGPAPKPLTQSQQACLEGI